MILIGVLARIVWQIRSGFYVHPETWEYDDVARNIVTGHGYFYRFLDADWRTYGTPLYPLTLALLHILGGGPDAYGLIGVFQATVSALAAAPAFWIGRRLYGDVAGLLAAAVVAVHPALVVYSAKVHELSLDVLLAALFLASVLDLSRNRSARQGGRCRPERAQR